MTESIGERDDVAAQAVLPVGDVRSGCRSGGQALRVTQRRSGLLGRHRRHGPQVAALLDVLVMLGAEVVDVPLPTLRRAGRLADDTARLVVTLRA